MILTPPAELQRFLIASDEGGGDITHGDVSVCLSA